MASPKESEPDCVCAGWAVWCTLEKARNMKLGPTTITVHVLLKKSGPKWPHSGVVIKAQKFTFGKATPVTPQV